ncbi:hypothetical protein BD779DRAFT_1675995 [Infundibulicybe gibba]|nr:hypothetical protein BD779DRAFT_1675995 [Infundibulicybe gibba]
MPLNLLLNLPAEILTNTLSFLPGQDLESCKLINRYVRNTIGDSARLRYVVALDDACVEDNPYNNTSISEKLQALTRRELSWRKLQPNASQSITVEHFPSGIYDLTNGVYFLGALDRLSLYYLNLPTLSSQTRALTWSRIDVEHRIVDMGLAIHESDLVAIITSRLDLGSTDTENSRFRLELNLLSFKTKEPHPLAEKPNILIGNISRVKPSISIEIVGDHLALATTYTFNLSQPPDHFYLWNWKTGALLIDHEAGYQTYSGIVFLTADLLLLSNIMDEAFEFWRIPSLPHFETQSNPVYVISLPPLSSEMKILAVSCRGEPNPVGPNSTLNSGQLFYVSSLQAIVLFRIYIASMSEEHFTLAFVVHRQSLIDIFNNRASPPSPEDASQHLPWSDWGPPVTRWIDTTGTPTRWITTTSGQRCVSICANTPSPIIIFDFNPYNVAKMKDYVRQYFSHRMFYDDEEEKLDDEANIFDVPVYSALPYCRYESVVEYTYDGVFIDEERLLGIKTDGSDDIISIDVMHFG